MKTLVTGGCGFIGQELVQQLVDQHGSQNVCVVDARTPAATGYYRVLDLNVKLFRGFVQRKLLMEQAVEDFDPDVIIHCAAQSHVDASLAAPFQTWQSNAIGTQVVAQVCTDFNIPMVYCSTDEVYGSTPMLQDQSDWVQVSEDALMNPSSPYSASKAAGEHAVRAMSHSYGLKYAITRGSNCFGPHQLEEKLIPIAIHLLKQGERVPLHGGGSQMRQWIHVSEFAGALHSVAKELVHGTHFNETYNLAGPDFLSVRSLVLAIAYRMGIAEADAVWDSEDRPGQDASYFIDGTKINNHLNVNPQRRILDPAELTSLIDHYTDSPVTPIIAQYVSKLERSGI